MDGIGMAGPDIFLSYNREDADQARLFAEGFATQGLDVWWDVALRSGWGDFARPLGDDDFEVIG